MANSASVDVSTRVERYFLGGSHLPSATFGSQSSAGRTGRSAPRKAKEKNRENTGLPALKHKDNNVKHAIAFALILAFASSTFAEIKTKVVEYKDGNTVLEGFVAWDTAAAKQCLAFWSSTNGWV